MGYTGTMPVNVCPKTNVQSLNQIQFVALINTSPIVVVHVQGHVMMSSVVNPRYALNYAFKRKSVNVTMDSFATHMVSVCLRVNVNLVVAEVTNYSWIQ